MKRTVSMLTAALFVGAMAMPALAQSPAQPQELPSPAASSPSGAGMETGGASRAKHHHRKHHRRSMKATTGENPAAEGSSSREKLKGEAAAPAAPAASPAAQ